MKRIALLVTAILLVSAIGGPAAAAVTPATDGAKGAQLDIRQPHYVESDVRQQSVNGTPLYAVRGEEFLIRPTNFRSQDVVEFGVLTDEGDLSREDSFDAFEFTNGGHNGTFTLYWIVEHETNVTRGNQTVTESERRRYEAKIRVEGATSMVHLTAEEADQRAYYRELGREVNSTIGDVRERDLLLATDEGTDLEIFQAMVNRYINTGDPIHGLFAGATQYWLLIFLGGAGFTFMAVATYAVLIWIINRLRRKLNIHRWIESEEGDLAERYADTVERERWGRLSDLDWNDLVNDPEFADALRETFGETPLKGLQELDATFSPRVIMRDRLQAMGQAGYSALVTEENGAPENVELFEPRQRPREPGKNERIDDLSDPSQDLVLATDWSDPVIREFDLPNADIEARGLDTETMDLENVAGTFNADIDRFGDVDTFGQLLLEYLESIEEHPATGDDGTVDSVRRKLETFTDLYEQRSDKHGNLQVLPMREAFQRAVDERNADKLARETLSEVRQGA